MRAEELYSCKDAGYPILHDTMLQLTVERNVGIPQSNMDHFSTSNETNDTFTNFFENCESENYDSVQVSSRII